MSEELDFRRAKKKNPGLTKEEYLNSDEATAKVNEADKSESDKIVEEDEAKGKDNTAENPDNMIGAAGKDMTAEKLDKNQMETTANAIEKGDDVPATVTKSLDKANSIEPNIMSFSGVKTYRNKLDDAVNTAMTGGDITEDQQNAAKQQAPDALAEFKKIVEEAKKGLETSKWGMPATIISAVITAATGGAIPFIPFIKLNGDSQKIAYLNKLNSIYAEKAQDFLLNKQTNKTNADKEIQKEAAEAGKTKAVENEAYWNAEQQQKFALERQRLLTELQGKTLAMISDLKNKSPAEKEKYFQEFLSGLTKEEKSEYLRDKAKLGKNMSDTEYMMNLFGQGTNIVKDMADTAINAVKPGSVK